MRRFARFGTTCTTLKTSKILMGDCFLSVSPWKHLKTPGFLMFSGGTERDLWHEMVKKNWNETLNSNKTLSIIIVAWTVLPCTERKMTVPWLHELSFQLPRMYVWNAETKTKQFRISFKVYQIPLSHPHVKKLLP